MNELSLFAGAGGGILASHIMGLRTICAVERDAYAAQVLAQRQNDGILRPFPIWSDITTFDGKPWRGIVDVISGGFPCQDISSAGKGAGIDGERSGLWSEMARIIGEVRPQYVFVENSPMLVSRGLARVISDLAKMGYDAHWARFSASNFGAPHQRDRIWIVGHSRSERLNARGNNNSKHDGYFTGTAGEHTITLANTTDIGLQGSGKSWFSCDPAENPKGETDRTFYERVGHIWGIKSRLGRVANGVAYRVDRLKAIGNGQVSIVAKSAFEYLGGASYE
ncbi:DNA cytosine methyltransferase [Acinetobacter sp. VNK23]|uniref:DNA cytosine methyltransferase n=1 Tax=Acinetobacter thutiue TaxID=2998078 RepID=UPI002578ED14|nr:DNA cytosine methyltransferase [Acinetobacter thutiue]MDM1019678.1 DNA cytosine methyltransferase [Acinetobacter thutiue]